MRKLFFNSLPSKYSLPSAVFSHLEDLFHRKCVWKELGGSLKASSGETHRGKEESAWLGSGYYYAQMLPSYVVIFANILALLTGISTLICMTSD